MFLDEKNEWDPPEPSQPSWNMPRGDKVVLWIVVFNVLMLALAPVGLVTLGPAIEAVMAVFGE